MLSSYSLFNGCKVVRIIPIDKVDLNGSEGM
jgi:hypothetical protein